MKKNRWFGLALVATMMGASFSACSNDAEEVLAQESEIKLTSEITPSRVTSLDYQSTQIVSGQQVGVTITGAKSDHNNVAWEARANGALSNTGDEVYYGNGTATITAYHPYNSAWTGTSHTFSVSTDQSTDAGYLASDLLWATKTATKSEETVALTFAHKLAKINVTLVPENEDTDLSGATIYICGTNVRTNFNPTSGDLSDATSTNIQEIKAGITTSTAYTASAIVIPQTIVAGTQFIRVIHGEKIYSYKLGSENKILTAGYSHNYTLTVKEKPIEIELISNNITNWTPASNIEGEIEEEDFSWFNPNKYITYVSNYERINVTHDAYTADITDYRSYIACPTAISRMEMKYKMAESSSTYYLCSGNLSRDEFNAISMNSSMIAFQDNEDSYKSYLWNDLNISPTDCMVLEVSFKDSYIKLNGSEIENNLPLKNTFGSYCFFSSYSKDSDDGDWLSWGGVPEGSKLYYVKVWDKDNNLVYLGGASKALNLLTNIEENCWRSYYKGETKTEFARYSTSLANRQPYGGGTDQ